RTTAATTSRFSARSRRSTTGRRRGWSRRSSRTSAARPASPGRRWRSGGSRSSRRPTTCAKRQPSRSSSACSRSARRCGRTIRKRTRRRGASSGTASRSATRCTTRSRAPTRWCSSPSGTCSASPISRRSGRCCARRSSSTAATSILPSTCARSDSPTSPLAGKPHTVLVTGGAGYIGSHAAKALARAGHRVVVYDSLVAGHREAVKYGEFVEADILDAGALHAAMRGHGIDAVMHFAAFLDVGESVRNPAKYYVNNVAGAINVLNAMADTGVRTLVFSSTCATYGEPVETPITESHPQTPINSYGESKLAAERAFPHYERAHGMRWTALRYFNAAGADPDGELGEDHDPEIHVIPRALDAAAGGEGLKVFGDDYPTPDGTCLRDYIHVSDLAD